MSIVGSLPAKKHTSIEYVSFCVSYYMRLGFIQLVASRTIVCKYFSSTLFVHKGIWWLIFGWCINNIILSVWISIWNFRHIWYFYSIFFFLNNYLSRKHKIFTPNTNTFHNFHLSVYYKHQPNFTAPGQTLLKLRLPMTMLTRHICPCVRCSQRWWRSIVVFPSRRTRAQKYTACDYCDLQF